MANILLKQVYNLKTVTKYVRGDVKVFFECSYVSV